MLARRWVGVAGVLIALIGLVRIVQTDADPSFEAEVALQSQFPAPRFGPGIEPDDVALLQAQLERREVTDLVRERLGHLPAVRLSPGDDRVVVLRSRAETPEFAARAAVTFATSYVDVRRQEAQRERTAAGDLVQRSLDELQPQIDQADGARLDALLQVREIFTERLDQLLREPVSGAEIIRSTPGTRTVDGFSGSLLAALGVSVLGAQTIARRRVRAMEDAGHAG